MRTFLLIAAVTSFASALGCNSSVSGAGTGASTTTGTGASSTGTGGSPPSCTAPADPQVFEIGTGQTCFERLTAGQTVPVMAGPQGGYHIWLAAGCSDCGKQMILQYGVKDPATQGWIAGTNPSSAVLPLGAASWPQQAGLTDFLPGLVYEPANILPKGTHVILSAAALDTEMVQKHLAEVEVVLGDMMSWNPPCDPSSTCGQPGGTPCCTD